jgi:hypothetical protein
MSGGLRRFTAQLSLALLFALLLAAPRPGFANAGALIAVVRDADSDERTLTRLRAELDALGLRVVEVSAPTGAESPRNLERAARDVGAFAALRIVSWERGIEVWIADRVTGKTVLRELVAAPGEATDEVVALRAVELLRASLLELELPQAHAGEVPAPPAVQRLVSRPRRLGSSFAPHFELDLGAGALLSPGGVAPTWQLVVSGRVVVVPRLGFEVTLSLPTLPSTIDEPEGSAEMSVFMGGVGLAAELLPRTSPWLLRAAAGAGAAALRLVGSARPAYVGRTDTVVVALPYGRLDLLYRIGPIFRLGGSIGAGLAFPRAAVSFADRRVATWGRPAGSGALLLELDFE